MSDAGEKSGIARGATPSRPEIGQGATALRPKMTRGATALRPEMMSLAPRDEGDFQCR